MNYEKEDNFTAHRLALDGRTRLTLTGVNDVERFDESEIIMSTTAGALMIRGEDLHIEKLSLDGGEIHITGKVNALSYEETRPSGGFFSRLLGG
jgi:sporulation protein YabP